MLFRFFRRNHQPIIRAFSNQSSITVKQVQASEFDDAVQLVAKVFLNEEPLAKAIGLTCNECTLSELAPCLHKPDEGISYQAVDQQNRILGLCLNTVNVVGDLETIRAHEMHVENPQLSFLMHVWALIHEESNLHAKFKCDKIFEMSNLASLPESRGRGVGLLLMQSSLDRCRQMGLKVARVDCTSAFSAKLAMKLDMKETWSKCYSDIEDPCGRICLIPTKTHTHIRTFVKEFQ